MTDPTTPSADQLREDAAHYRELAASRGCVADCLTCARDHRAAAALEAEAARLEREATPAPTLAELDAAVEDAYKYALEVCEHALNHDSAARLLNALIAAAEARGAARVRASVALAVAAYNSDRELQEIIRRA
jgi:GNAT superfamily N-acetyltransferase